MKKTIICVVLLLSIFTSFSQQNNLLPGDLNPGEIKRTGLHLENVQPLIPKDISPVANVFIITLDGFRWQELFNGADSMLLSNNNFTPACAALKALYWAPTPEERRKKLMPFFWSVIGENGQVYGNRFYDSKVNVSNSYSMSYPGYNEIFTGIADPEITSNKKLANPNSNVLEYLNTRAGFEDKVVAFTSWDVFPYILNKQRSGFLINSGYDTLSGSELSKEETLINKTEDGYIFEPTSTRYDQLTFLVAKEYIRQHQPRVVFLGLGETDEFAHHGRYDLYLEQANQADKMLAHLWHLVQTTPGYAGNTIFIITTDHGRGRNNKWTSHGQFIAGSTETWIALMGQGLQPMGEVKQKGQLYQQQVAQAIAALLGEEFRIPGDDHNIPAFF